MTVMTTRQPTSARPDVAGEPDGALTKPTAADERAASRQRARELFAQLANLADDDPRREGVRAELVTLHLGLVHFLARRFAGRGEPHDDLAQVATVGLIKAVDRFEPERGLEFSTFATPTIVGEIKRHFRDTGWAIHVPRRLQELSLAVTRGAAQLSIQLGRSATVEELASHLGVTSENVLEGLECARAYSTMTLDGPTGGGDQSPSLGETLGEVDPGMADVEVRETLRPLLAALPERERTIVMLRFFKNMTQSQIAAEVGISQMHVSRLLAQTLERLRNMVPADESPL